MKKYHYTMLMAAICFVPHMPDWVQVILGSVFTFTSIRNLLQDK